MKYTKPEMKFVDLCSKETVADTCWGYHDKNKELRYFDSVGEGYVSFSLTPYDKKCGGAYATNVMYYTGVGAEAQPASVDQMKEVNDRIDMLMVENGNNGQPVKGLSNYFPTSPIESWS